MKLYTAYLCRDVEMYSSSFDSAVITEERLSEKDRVRVLWWRWDNKLTRSNEYFKRFILSWAIIIGMAMHLHALLHDIEEMCDKNWRKSARTVAIHLWNKGMKRSESVCVCKRERERKSERERCRRKQLNTRCVYYGRMRALGWGCLCVNIPNYLLCLLIGCIQYFVLSSCSRCYAI